MTIERHELLPLFVWCCPGLRDRLVETADEWLNDDGSINYTAGVVLVLERFVVERLDGGDYSFADDLFALVERLLTEGSQAVKNIVATGFLEAMQHQQRLSGELWVPLTGPKARDYMRAWDKFTGVNTPGLDDTA